ncbi:hypothetical protein K435DRAFT_843305 [Dendrothele bispora CBS 962.96]|uniref:Peptidase C14 caspase domain-containing protein n=1 Tax=Dendrothele bispora (strain CBS 962.96) TaxID=1314807 RepID=A0A4S8L9B6_DENBC|nr:hypothetical protein K435DRAFT_843305 [Dendrothele bispora CBS 962.96]
MEQDIANSKRFGLKIHALLIGIDKYKDPNNVTTLAGCVNDCNDVKAWVDESFTFPHTMLLQNHEATRDAIIKQIGDIATSKYIDRGHPILIYFAGHGAQVEPLKEWELPSERKIQMCIPYDFSLKPIDGKGMGILDRDLSEAIAKVAKKKGDNIVVILDSCHSASGTRGEAEATRAIKIPSDYAKSASLKKEDFSPSGDTMNCSRASSTTPTNHILLSACREDEWAKEKVFGKGKRGIFTQHLFTKLREAETESMTYGELILSLPLAEYQHPHCDAIDKDRIVFSLNHKRREFHSIDPPNQGNPRYLQLGAPHGVQKSDCFLLFKEDKFSSESCVGEGSVVDLKGFKSVLQVPQKSDPAFAVRTIQSPSISIIVPEEVLEPLPPWFLKLGVKLVTKADQTHEVLKLVKDENRVKFEFLNAEHSVAETHLHSWPLEKDSLVRLFHQMGHFYHHLRHTPSPILSIPVQVSIVLLKDMEPIDNSDTILSPSIPVKVLADGEPRYGFKVTNTSNKGIFFSLFYFGLRQFNIDALYNPPTVTSGVPTACLAPNEFKTIGYGNPGDEGFCFSLEGSAESDVGYLRLFFSYQYLDFLHIRRSNLFHEERELSVSGRGLGKGRMSRNLPQQSIVSDSTALTTGALTFPIVQLPKSRMGGHWVCIHQPEGFLPPSV